MAQNKFQVWTQERFIRYVVSQLSDAQKPKTPAYTLILGGGFSFGVVPTTTQMLQHDIAWWLYCKQQGHPDDYKKNWTFDGAFRDFTCEIWRQTLKDCGGFQLNSEDLPLFTSAENVAACYRSIMSIKATRGLARPAQRRQYLADVITKAGPKINGAHLFLAGILAAQERWTDFAPFCRMIFTTNFDPQLQRALQLFNLLYTLSDRPHFLDLPDDSQGPTIHLVYAHGTVYQHVLINSDQEIDDIRHKNADIITRYVQKRGIIVIGYGGWDDAIMAGLSQCNTFDGNLFWCAQREPTIDSLRPNVLKLLEEKSAQAVYVPVTDADALMLELHDGLALGRVPSILREPIPQLIRQIESLELPSMSLTKTPPAQGQSDDAALSKTNSSFNNSLKEFGKLLVEHLQAAQKWMNQSEPADAQIASDAHWTNLLQEALALATSGDIDGAISLWSRIIDSQQVTPQQRANALFNRGVAYRQQGKPDLEIADYTAVVAMPDAPAERKADALVNRGIAYSQQGKPDLEIADYGAVVAMSHAPVEPKAMALFNRGVAYSQQGKPELEIADYSAILAMPDAPAEPKASALTNRGLTYVQQRKRDLAIADFAAVVAMPDAPARQRAKALFNRGVAYGEQGKPELAIADYAAVVAMPDAPAEQKAKALINRGNAYSQQGKPDLAIADYAAALAMPDAPAEQKATALINRGIAYRRQDKPDLEIADYVALLAMPDVPSEQNAMALVNRGVAYGRQGKPDLAIADFAAALVIPDAPAEQKAKALFNRGLAYSQQGKADLEIADYAAVLAMPDAPEEVLSAARDALRRLGRDPKDGSADSRVSRPTAPKPRSLNMRLAKARAADNDVQ
ncbi:MAG: tetratricopeptide repeat protein [Tepidisphaeraceae bacterium]|jgi:tetratricopeptide (TPR) repeat protein